MSILLYNLFLLLYRVALGLAARFNPKARLWVDGRLDWENRLRTAIAGGQGPLTWMHCASLGEFEQGRPIIEHIRENNPSCRILVSFFSPSGYEIRKNYAGADIVCYLPMDGAKSARTFIEIISPELVIWIKYEFWYHYLTRLHAKGIPVLLVSGLFRPGQPFFKWYGRLHRHMLSSFKQIFVQNQSSLELLQSIGINHVTVTGDTRYDRVSAIAGNFSPIEPIEAFTKGHKVIVAGSTWPEDEEELDHFANSHPQYRFILAPHETLEVHLKEMERLFRPTIRYSQWVNHPARSSSGEGIPHIMIIDNIGMLSRLYHYADIAYIGGGFGGDGLHNILEAAVYGIPVVHGPNFEKFPEAIELLEAGGSFAVNTALELENKLNDLLMEDNAYRLAGRAAGDFVMERRGATGKVIHYITVNRLLTN